MNVAILVPCLFSAVLAASNWQNRAHPKMPTEADGPAILFFFISFGCAVLLCFRHRGNLLIPSAVAACIPPLLLPTDALPALIGVGSVLVWCAPLLPRLAITSLATVATGVSVWRDTRGTRINTSFWNGTFHNATDKTWQPMPFWQVLVVTLICVATTTGIASLRRSRLRAARAEDRADAATRTAHGLQQDVARHDEREALAREVHDVLGHRLSILSMQASALEIESADANPSVRARAQQIRSGASESMVDLRSLLTLLREGPASADRPSDLADIATLVRECIAAGTPVSSNVFVDRSSPLDDVVSRSAHRIATEMLTNARKHAPGRPVSLEIFGDPQTGLTLTATNPLVPHSQPATSGTRSGLTGMSTRAHDLSGTFSAGPTPDGRHFSASAHLPWHLPNHRNEDRA